MVIKLCIFFWRIVGLLVGISEHRFEQLEKFTPIAQIRNHFNCWFTVGCFRTQIGEIREIREIHTDCTNLHRFLKVNCRCFFLEHRFEKLEKLEKFKKLKI
jgi:hypothetical protein